MVFITEFCYQIADIISTVEFNQDGEFLATGDKGGRVVVFQRDGTKVRIATIYNNRDIPYMYFHCLKLIYKVVMFILFWLFF